MKSKKKNKVKSPFRSGLEETLYNQLVSKKVGFSYEPKDRKVAYVIPASNHSYLPDFYVTTKSGKEIIVEAKGIWDFKDRYKHLLIRRQNPELDIRFVFSNSKSKIRKGSKTTYADICEGRGTGMFKGVTWDYTNKTIPPKWLEE